ALVGVDGLEVQEVSDHRVLVDDPGGAEDVPRHPRRLERHDTLFIFAIEICWGRTPAPSFRPPSWRHRSWALVLSVTIHRRFFWTSWGPAIGFPNWTRVWAYWSAQS